jgi:osmotically inducible protein OsmC
MAMTRTASASWSGSLLEGSGTTRLDSGAADELELTWRARTDEADGKTSPEELIAAAHASCFAMALSHVLSEDGNDVEALDSSADVTIDETDEGWRIKSVALKVRGKVDMDEKDFIVAADTAKESCPVSNALRGNVEITLEAGLDS